MRRMFIFLIAIVLVLAAFRTYAAPSLTPSVEATPIKMPRQFSLLTHQLLPIVRHPEATPTPFIGTPDKPITTTPNSILTPSTTMIPELTFIPSRTLTPTDTVSESTLTIDAENIPVVNQDLVLLGDVGDGNANPIANITVNVTYEYDSGDHGTWCSNLTNSQGEWTCSRKVDASLQDKDVLWKATITLNGRIYQETYDDTPTEGVIPAYVRVSLRTRN